MSDHYQTLGVDRNASPDEIKKAYRKMAAIHHPDKGGDTATFQKVQEAYDNLSNPEKKAQYDNPNPFGQHGGSPFGFQFSHGGSVNDIFAQMFGGGNHNFFGHGFQRQNVFRTIVWVTLEQVCSGGEQLLSIQLPSGKVEAIKIDIPVGVDNGTQLKYENIVPDAILIAEFRVQPNPKFERNGPDLISTVDISVLDLILGTTLKFTTIKGKELEVDVPERTQPGTMLKVKGEGIPYNLGAGDQYLLLKPFIPANIDASVVNSIRKSQTK
jgi:curved DNA-binding protein